jgi:beta-galactosidase
MNNCRFFLCAKICLCYLVFASLTFAQFTRQRYAINTSWKFIKSNILTGAEVTGYNDAGWQSVTIPHDFNGGSDNVNNDVFSGPSMYRGAGWYRTHITIGSQYQGKKVFVEFEAVSLVADVYINGTRLGQHRGGYTAFSYDITQYVVFGGDNVLAVRANSVNDNTVAPWMYTPFGTYPSSYDYAVYGGIYRDVWITITDQAKVEATFVSTPNVSAASSQVRVRTEVRNYAAAAQSVTLTTSIVDAAGTQVTSMVTTQSITGGQTYTFDQTSGTISTPHLWSPTSPYLYKVKSALTVSGAEIDQFESPLGFRWYTFPHTGGQFSLNGQVLYLQGVNRHQDILGRGYAMTNAQHLNDIRLIKEGGFNFLRHAHYPADPVVMQACDSLGLLVWLEVPVTVSMSTDAAFLTNAQSQLTEMIRQNYNHPSVILWSIGNESDQAVNNGNLGLTEAYTNTFNTSLNNLAHSLDATRRTAASNWKLASNQNIPDVYSPHVWVGWYSGGSGAYNTYNPTAFTSEYGADAEITRHKEPGTQVLNDWSQEYQCLLHEAYVARGQAVKTQFPGQCVWVTFDFASPRSDRTTANGNTINYMNQKGLFLHDHTTPKDVYYFYKSFYTSAATAPMVYIVSHTWLNRWTAPASRTVWAYSNCDSVELFNAYGTQSFGKRARTAGENTVKTRFQWDNINVRYNVLCAECLVGGRVMVRDTVILSNLPSPPGVATMPGHPGKTTPAGSMRIASSHGAYSLHFISPDKGFVRLSLYRVNGSLVATTSRDVQLTGNRNVRLNAGPLARGAYYARAETNGGSWTKRVIIQ